MLGDQPIVNESQFAALGFATGGGCSPSSDVTTQVVARQCTAPCLQGVSKEFVLIGCVLRKRSVFILYFTHPHLFNENKLRTHTKQGAVLFFPAQFTIKNPPE